MRRLSGGLLFLLSYACGSDGDNRNTQGPPTDAGFEASVAPIDATAPPADADVSAPPAGPLAGNCGPTRWTRAFGDGDPEGLFDAEGARGIAVGTSGDVYVTGTYRGAADFGGGPLEAGASNQSMFVARVTTDGDPVWSEGFGDASGGLLFAPQATGTSLAVNAAGEVVVGGSFAGIVDFGGGALLSRNELQGAFADGGLVDDAGADGGPAVLPFDAQAFGGCLFSCSPDVVVLKLDAQGGHVWSRRFGDQEGDAASAVALDGEDNVLVTGSFRGMMRWGDDVLTAASASESDIFVGKLDRNGDPLWARSFGGPSDDVGSAIAVDGTGQILVGGAYAGEVAFDGESLTASGNYDGFVAKLDPNGAVSWVRGLEASDRGHIFGVDSDANDAVVVAGLFRGESHLGTDTLASAADDALVGKLDASGATIWVKSLGASANDASKAVATDPSGHVYATGAVTRTVDFGGGPLPGGYSDELFVVELDVDGNHVCSRRYAGDVGTSSSGEAIAVAAGRTFIGGSFTGSVDFGNDVLSSSGGSDVLVGAFESNAP